MVETKRGCGYRSVGSLYLVGEGIGHPCDNLPLRLVPCSCCGYEIPFTRSWVWVNKNFLKDHSLTRPDDSPACTCSLPCPVCYPQSNIAQEKFMVMWVGKRSYTPTSFIKEASSMGVSRKIPAIPKGLKVGETWVMLAFKNYPYQKDFPKFRHEAFNLKSEPVKCLCIFYAYRPQRIEMLIWKREATPDRIRELEERGITPIIVKDDDSRHVPSRGR